MKSPKTAESAEGWPSVVVPGAGASCDLVRVAGGMRSSTESIKVTMQAFLGRLPSAEQGEAEVGLSVFWEDLSRVALNWMGQGQQDELMNLWAAFRATADSEADGWEAFGKMTFRQRLLVRVQCWSEIIGIYLRTDNLSKHLGRLAGVRYKRWRDTLLKTEMIGRPIAVADLVPELFDTKQAASDALNKMGEWGLFEKTHVGAQQVAYALTWSGRSITMSLRQPEMLPTAPVPIQEPPNSGIRNPEIDKKTGLDRRRLIRRAREQSVLAGTFGS